MIRTLVWLCLLMIAWPASAQWVRGTGEAAIENGNVAEAREKAREAALRDAALKREATISSQDTMKDGRLTESRLTVSAQARARHVQVIREEREGGVLRLTIEADLTGQGQCEANDAYRMQKRVAVTGFPVAEPDQGRVGRLEDAGRVVSARLGRALQAEGRVQVLNAHRMQLFGNVGNAPTHQRFDNSLSNVVNVARELDAQFVVAGVIRDMSLVEPDAWGTSVLDQMQRGIGLADTRRRFVVDLMVYDGYSGSPVYQERLSRVADWDEGINVSEGLGSDALRNTDYGRVVAGAVEAMGSAVQQSLACQPFITRIRRVDGRQVQLSSGATAGLRPGDKLHLYRSFRYSDQPDAMPELRDTGRIMSVNNVHPNFSSGVMNAQGGQVNLQQDDVAIIW
ncbi:flagellar assembly T-like protein [Tamilnaduibacter salinus]|uniref:Flagellar assembly T-like protein n=1 Tax=Tamilnaduibacter salinus TaxID=1484056 RepID=A0A2A2I4J8_9GAMM|nr:flagellar assembly protein T N-terminal domain-containing protein [Tamilnaduibacter salinus]PAV26587.1 hypothetical protein CF392_05110 [Tamilnaduibacter salinus]PVY75869.1 flagellar assembly T-like protein [Tamilnaduibacter salinus]